MCSCVFSASVARLPREVGARGGCDAPQVVLARVEGAVEEGHPRSPPSHQDGTGKQEPER